MLHCISIERFSNQNQSWSVLVYRREQEHSRLRLVVGPAPLAAGRRTDCNRSRHRIWRRRVLNDDQRRRAPFGPVHPCRSCTYFSYTLAGSGLGPMWWSFRSGGVSWAGASRRFTPCPGSSGCSPLPASTASAAPCSQPASPWRPCCCCQRPSSFLPICTRPGPTCSRCSSWQSSSGPTGAWPCTHARQDAAQGSYSCWARPGYSTPITSARCCCRRWRSSTCSSCVRSAAGGSR